MYTICVISPNECNHTLLLFAWCRLSLSVSYLGLLSWDSRRIEQQQPLAEHISSILYVDASDWVKTPANLQS